MPELTQKPQDPPICAREIAVKISDDYLTLMTAYDLNQSSTLHKNELELFKNEKLPPLHRAQLAVLYRAFSKLANLDGQSGLSFSELRSLIKVVTAPDNTDTAKGIVYAYQHPDIAGLLSDFVAADTEAERHDIHIKLIKHGKLGAQGLGDILVNDAIPAHCKYYAVTALQDFGADGISQACTLVRFFNKCHDFPSGLEKSDAAPQKVTFDDETFQTEIVYALRNMGAQATPYLLETLSSPHARFQAVRRTIQALAQLSHDMDEPARKQATNMVALLAARDKNPWIRDSAESFLPIIETGREVNTHLLSELEPSDIAFYNSSPSQRPCPAYCPGPESSLQAGWRKLKSYINWIIGR